ncbi:MAG: glycosyltransferase family 39 protein [Patescibacteria group bacterium]
MKNKILILIIVLSFIFRFYRLGEIPLSLNWDEVSNSYNAYSILKTGRDEYGNFLPLTNRSFDDYKPPLYMYLDIVPVALVGLNEIAARLPSALFGVMSVYAIYLLTKRLSKNEKTSRLSALLFSISPWNLLFSRVGFEANIGLFFSIITLMLFHYALRYSENNPTPKNKLFLVLSAIFAALSLYSYHSVRIFLPLILFVSAVIYRENLLKFDKKILSVSILLGIALTLPLVLLNPKEAITGRYATTTLKARSQDLEKSVSLINEDSNARQFFGNIIHNRRLVILESTLQKYISHFDINYLFTSGDDNPRHHLKTNGLLFLVMLPPVLYGVFSSLKKNSKETLFLFSWLIVAPIPAAFGDAFPHAIRSYLMVVPLTIFGAIGLKKIVTFEKFAKFTLALSSLILLATVVAFLHNYFAHYNKEEYSSWQYGYKGAVFESAKLKDQFEKVIIDPGIEQGYAFWLFYLKYDPKAYQESGNAKNFDKFYFEDNLPKDDNSLFVSPSEKFPESFILVKTIYNSENNILLKLGHP